MIKLAGKYSRYRGGFKVMSDQWGEISDERGKKAWKLV